MKKMMILAVFVSAVVISACAGDPCSGSSKCSADPAPTDAGIAACKDAVKDGVKCAAEYRAVQECGQANQVCGTDNKTDFTATAAKCATQNAAYLTCFTGPADAGTDAGM